MSLSEPQGDEVTGTAFRCRCPMQDLLSNENINCVERHSDASVLAVGTADGSVILLDLRLSGPQTRCAFDSDVEIGAVTFRPAHPHALYIARAMQILELDTRRLTHSTHPVPVSR